MDNRPIGIFDSGLGGLTVLGAVNKLMPCEDLIYLGDNGRAPYGTKSEETVRRYTYQDINFLLGFDVKTVVIACNTASACSLGNVLRDYDKVTVVEVVDPGAELASGLTRNKKIGIIGTNATVNSGIYEREIRKYIPDCSIYSKACPMLVPLVEEGWWDGKIAELIIEKYLKEIKDWGADTLILGCTHYPYLEKIISEYMGDSVRTVNSAMAVAARLEKKLTEKDLLTDRKDKGKVEYYTTDSISKFVSLGKMFLKKEPEPVHFANLESVSPEAYVR